MAVRRHDDEIRRHFFDGRGDFVGRIVAMAHDYVDIYVLIAQGRDYWAR